jgi:phosphopantothenate synthetase
MRREAGYLAELAHAERTKDRASMGKAVLRMEANPVSREARALGLRNCAETVEPGH